MAAATSSSSSPSMALAVDDAFVCELVLDYLLHGNYYDTAVAFWKTVIDRRRQTTAAASEVAEQLKLRAVRLRMPRDRDGRPTHPTAAMGDDEDNDDGDDTTSTTNLDDLALIDMSDTTPTPPLKSPAKQLKAPVLLRPSLINTTNINTTNIGVPRPEFKGNASPAPVPTPMAHRNTSSPMPVPHLDAMDVDTTGKVPAAAPPEVEPLCGVVPAARTVTQRFSNRIQLPPLPSFIPTTDEVLLELAQRPEFTHLFHRKAAMNLVLNGETERAVVDVSRQFEGVFSSAGAHDLLFRLRCQQFIELIRQGQPREALRFAQTELVSFGYESPRYLQNLQDIVSLLAYNDPFMCPMSHLLAMGAREELAEYMSACLLRFSGSRACASLVAIVRQLTVLRDVINTEPQFAKERPKFGRWSLSEFVNAAVLSPDVKPLLRESPVDESPRLPDDNDYASVYQRAEGWLIMDPRF